MNRYTKWVGASVAAGILTLAGTVAAADLDAKTQLNDTWLTARTKIALAADGRVKGHQVSVETNDGVVKLRGKVDNEAAKNAAREIAKGMDGVTKVDNELQVVAPSKRDSVDLNDEAITARVKEQINRDAELMKDYSLKAADIGVVTNAGVVNLTGNVRSITISAQASWTAWQVQGVKSVRNDLTVASK